MTGSGVKIGITTFGGDGGMSGISRYIIHLLREFAAMDAAAEFEVMAYANERGLFLPDPERLRSLCFGDGLRSPVANILWHQVCLPLWAKRRGYDVLFLPAGNRRLPLAVGAPTVGAVHDLSSIHVAKKYDPARMFYIKRVLPFLIRRLTRVVTVSENSKRDIVEFAGVPEERVTVTPLAADHDLFYPRDREEAAERVSLRYGVRPPYITFIARIEHPGKNHARLIRAFARLKASEDLPHQLVLAGSEWTRASEVRAAAEESGWAQHIVFTGFVPGEGLPDLYAGADLFVFPSLYEGFGLPVLEAMCCGTPVACSNVSSMPEVAGDAALLFDPYDEDSMADALGRMLMDEGLRDDYTQRGLARCAEFSWRRTAEQTLETLLMAAEAG